MNDPRAETDPAAGIRVQVTDLKSSADALYFEDDDGQPVLLIRRLQSFPSAVEGVQDAMEISEERARAIVRFHHPEAVTWGEQDASHLLAVPPSGPVPPARKQGQPPAPESKPARHLRLVPRWTVTAIAAVAALGASYTLAGERGASQATPDATGGIQLSDAQPYASAAFKDFATDGEMSCTPTGPLEAKCVDVDGKVLYSEASVGSDWTQFSFTYDKGDNQIGLRVFSNEAAAKLWAQEDGSRESVHNLIQYGRFALWGNDSSRIQEYLCLLKDQDEPSSVLESRTSGRHAGEAEHVVVAAGKQAQPKPHQPKHAKKKATVASGRAHDVHVQRVQRTASAPVGQVAPMPRRLAVLALGTLGIDPANPPTLAEANTLQEMGTLVAVSIVMGVDPADTGMPVQDILVLDMNGADGVTNAVNARHSAMFEGGEHAVPAKPETVAVMAPAADRQPPTVPAMSQPQETPATTPQEPAGDNPSTQPPAPEDPPLAIEPVETGTAAPIEQPVLEGPAVEPEQPVDEGLDGAVTTPPADAEAPMPVEEPDTGAEPETAPDAWCRDQAAQG
ncbi:hypothetical protein [Streptomyces sp. NPDC058751]|uniref:hypothetical protein n=1 Tax=Streptomyces sp. NPDC058751 TaxID=3346623 RepID=UPI0036AA18C7